MNCVIRMRFPRVAITPRMKMSLKFYQRSQHFLREFWNPFSGPFSRRHFRTTGPRDFTGPKKRLWPRLAVGIDMQLRDGSIFEPGAGAISAGLQDGQKMAVLAPKFALDLPSGYVGYVNKWLLKIALYS